MTKTFHFKTTFDTKLVLQEKDLEEVQKLLAKVDAGTSKDHLADQKRSGMGKSLDERIALVARATIRNAVAELLAEEFPEGYSFSPAKVTQVVIPRIQAAAEECTGEGTCKCQSDDCEFI